MYMYHCTTYMFSCPSRSMGVSRLRSPAWWASGFPGNLQQCTPWSVVMHICIIYHYVSLLEINLLLLLLHHDVIKWKHFPRYWPFVRGIHRGPVPGDFPSQRPVTRSFVVFFDFYLSKRLSKHSRWWWFETLSLSSWRHCNDMRKF